MGTHAWTAPLCWASTSMVVGDSLRYSRAGSSQRGSKKGLGSSEEAAHSDHRARSELVSSFGATTGPACGHCNPVMTSGFTKQPANNLGRGVSSIQPNFACLAQLFQSLQATQSDSLRVRGHSRAPHRDLHRARRAWRGAPSSSEKSRREASSALTRRRAYRSASATASSSATAPYPVDE